MDWDWKRAPTVVEGALLQRNYAYSFGANEPGLDLRLWLRFESDSEEWGHATEDSECHNQFSSIASSAQ